MVFANAWARIHRRDEHPIGREGDLALRPAEVTFPAAVRWRYCKASARCGVVGRDGTCHGTAEEGQEGSRCVASADRDRPSATETARRAYASAATISTFGLSGWRDHRSAQGPSDSGSGSSLPSALGRCGGPAAIVIRLVGRNGPPSPVSQSDSCDIIQWSHPRATGATGGS